MLARLEGTGRTIYAVGFSPDSRYLSWGHTAAYTSPNRQGPLEQRFDLTLLTHLPGGIADASPVQALERLGTLALVLEQEGLISITPVSTCKTARDDSALLSVAIPMATATAPTR